MKLPRDVSGRVCPDAETQAILQTFSKAMASVKLLCPAGPLVAFLQPNRPVQESKRPGRNGLLCDADKIEQLRHSACATRTRPAVGAEIGVGPGRVRADET